MFYCITIFTVKLICKSLFLQYSSILLIIINIILIYKFILQMYLNTSIEQLKLQRYTVL